MFSSAVYGIKIRSEWALDLPGGEYGTRGNLDFRRDKNNRFQEAARATNEKPGAASSWFRLTVLPDDWLFLRWTELFEFLVSPDGRTILCNPLAKATDESFHLYLLNQVLSFALLRQGIEQLHATVVEVDGEAVAFVGDCGYGKSSLGAAFLAQGHRMLTDDLLVVERRDEKLMAFPGPRRIKLFPEIANAILPKLAGRTPMNNVTPKLVIRLEDELVAPTTLPLGAVYVLVPATRVRTKDKILVRRPASPAAFLSLVKNTFNIAITGSDRLRAQFEWAMEIAGRVPIKTLSYPRDLAQLPAVYRSVVADFRRSSRQGLKIKSLIGETAHPTVAR